MKIFAFFSFKGGVGRTLLMTNLAAYWASRGKVIGMVDMDLAAPGLSYSPLLLGDPLSPERKARPGFSNLLAKYYQDSDGQGRIGYENPMGLFQEMRDPDGKPWAKKGRILVMGAGNIHFSYPPMTSDQPVPTYPPKGGRKNAPLPEKALRAFSILLKRDLQRFRLPGGPDGQERGFDYVLIDCSTGFPELQDLVMGYLADRMVLVSGLNKQNLAGLDLTLAALRAERVEYGAYARDISVVFSPVPAHAQDDPVASRALKEGEEILDNHRLSRKGQQQEAAPIPFELPYTPHMASSEVPLTALNLKHPYSRVIVEIAEDLEGRRSLEEQSSRMKRDLERFGGVSEPLPKKKRDEFGVEEPQSEEDCSQIVQLPHWHWPISLDPNASPEELDRCRGELLPVQDHWRDLDRDGFLDALSGSISLSIDEKKKILKSLDGMSTFQVTELLRIFQEERSKWSAMEIAHADQLLGILLDHQVKWAGFILNSVQEGLRRTLLWPLEGLGAFPDWEKRWHYWSGLAKRIREELGLKDKAYEALERAINHKTEFEQVPIILKNLLDPNDRSWNRRVLELGYREAKEDPWLNFLIFRNEINPPPERVESFLQPLLQQPPPDDAERCFRLAAWVLDHQPKWGQEVEPFLRHAIHLNPERAHFHCAQGNLFKNHLNRYEEAEAAYRKAIELDSSYALPWNGLGNLLQDHLNRYEEAEAAYRKAIELDSDFAHPWNGLGSLLVEHLNRYEEAEAAFRKAIELDSDFAAPWYNLGNLLKDHLSRYEEAEAAFRKAIELDSDLAAPWNGLGNLLQAHLNRYEEAEAAYRKAIELDSSYALPWYGLGNLLQKHLNRYEEAEAAYRKAIELDPNFAYPWNGLGSLLQDHLYRYEEAAAAFRKAIELDSDYAYSWNGLGLLLRDDRRCQEALEAFDEGLQRGDNAYLQMNRGHMLLLLGEREAAHQALKKARDAFNADSEQDDPGVFNRIALDLALGETAAPADLEHFAAWLERDAEDVDLHLLEFLLRLEQSAVPAENPIAPYLKSYSDFKDCLEFLYLMAGQRSDLRQALQRQAANLLQRYPELQKGLKGAPLSEDHLKCYRPFARGESDGLGDPRDRELFCREAK